jgi:hypothetical protein
VPAEGEDARHHADQLAGRDLAGAYEGETRLEMQENGDFAGTIPVTYVWGPMTMPGGSCTVTPSNPNDTIDVAGLYGGRGTARCNSPAWTGTA